MDECNEPWNRVRPSQGVLLTLGEARELRELLQHAPVQPDRGSLAAHGFPIDVPVVSVPVG